MLSTTPVLFVVVGMVHFTSQVKFEDYDSDYLFFTAIIKIVRHQSRWRWVDARRVLPCFDEPDLKATFKTEIEHRSHMVALTNGIEEKVDDLGNGWVRTSYKQTPIMPTYLLAFTVGEFAYLEANTTNGCRVGVILFPLFDLVEARILMFQLIELQWKQILFII